jgi:hypothetical protein
MESLRRTIRTLQLATATLIAATALAATPALAANVTVNVVDGNGDPVQGFRYLLQEDQTFAVDPNNPATDPDDLLALSFHRSYHPIARAEGTGEGLRGNSDSDSATITDVPGGTPSAPARYFLSVLPYDGYGIGGAPVQLDGGSASVTVVVQEHPIPTAQITVFLFRDSYPINGAPDLPEEENPPAGDPGHVDWTQFNVTLEEPAGRYGAAGGPVIRDAFGNPLGTTYDANGDVLDEGDGTLSPDENGYLTIKNLAPGKYGVIVVPPSGQGWQQSTTIEGTKVIDAWVKANEPANFVEFGLPGPHVFMGFVQPFDDLGTGGATISGTITDMHMSRPPNFEFFSGRPFPDCWIAINEGGAAPGLGLYAQPCNGDSSFSIDGLAEGAYQMSIFDSNLDIVIGSLNFSVDPGATTCNGGGSCDFGDVAVFNWFTRLITGVFTDDDQDGFWDADESGVGSDSQNVNLRWRDGTVYQNFATDIEGWAPFDEAFPFFHWMVAEVSFATKKATGVTVVVDAGGEVETDSEGFPGFGQLNPQPQPENGNADWRTETGPVLTQATQGFLGQTSVLLFGKADYATSEIVSDCDPINCVCDTPFPFCFDGSVPDSQEIFIGENGGISGIVYSATTRAENDPALAVAELWEPGVPRTQLALYADGDIDSPPLADVFDPWPNSPGDVDWDGDGVFDFDDQIIDDINDNGQIDYADVDNYPLGNFPGPEDVDHNDNGTFDLGDAVQVTYTDSWDDSLPTDCPGDNQLDALGVDANRCFDGLRNFNQVRPGVFDGGYAFNDYDLTHLQAVASAPAADIQAYYDNVNNNVVEHDPDLLQLGLIPGQYIVQVAPPPGYEIIKEEDKNVDFGDEYIPADLVGTAGLIQPAATLPPCVGDDHTVPPYFSMSTKDGSGDLDQLIAGLDPTDAAAPFAGDTRPLCDFKAVQLSSAENTAAEFFLMTDVPPVANVTGGILNDLANEFNPNSPAFGEKYAPPFMPVAFYDWAGEEVTRIYADEYGRYNAVVPSTYTANLPQPSGMSPNMLTSCMNDSGPIPNPAYDPINNPDVPQTIIDPNYDPQFSQFCYTFQYMPGATTYLDTPVVGIAAYTNPREYPVECERPNRTPMIGEVTNLSSTDGGPFVEPGNTIRITSLGYVVEVENPQWDGTSNTPRTIAHAYDFGTRSGRIKLVDRDGNETYLARSGRWTPNRVDAVVPANMSPGDYQLVVERRASRRGAPNVESPMGVTLTVGTGPNQGERPDGGTYTVHHVSNGESIQAAIDAADPGDMVLVGPGVYDELVIMWKPVKLQGWGPRVTTISARQVPTEKVDAWRAKVAVLVDDGAIDLLPGQNNAPGFNPLGAALFPTEEGAGIFVAGNTDAGSSFADPANQGARIDGFTIQSASQGGGIVVNGYNGYMDIGNNRLVGNSGFYGGGIRIGHPTLQFEDTEGNLYYTDADNDQIRIHHNEVVKNGGQGGAGGAISLYTGSDGYVVEDNWICGNFTIGDGGGIGHLGLSDGGVIRHNQITFNESFSQASAQSGGGIFIGGQPALQANVDGLLLTPGTGDVTIDGNVIRGNMAGVGDGSGIRIASVNGEDVAASPGDEDPWYGVQVYNNIIANNIAGLAGAVSIEDALKVDIRHNTIANNDSTSTAAAAFLPGSSNASVPLPAGVVSRVHGADLSILLQNVAPAVNLIFSDPTLSSNIIQHNRSFYWVNYDDPGTSTIETGLFPSSCLAPPDGANCDITTLTPDDFTWDLGVLSATTEQAETLSPTYSLLSASTLANYSGGGTNLAGDADFVDSYFNGSRDALNVPEFTTIQTAGAFDEGGNFIQVAFGPLIQVDPNRNPAPFLIDYHIGAGSAAIGGAESGASGLLAEDIDAEARPASGADIGADER